MTQLQIFFYFILKNHLLNNYVFLTLFAKIEKYNKNI